MSSTVIRDFLVALNFKVDSTGEKKSKDALENMQKAAVVLNRALIALASAAVYGVAKTANELEKLYYSSQRIGASAENIKAYGDAVSQLGGDASEAIGSLENVARKLRESPGYEGMIKGLGVATRDQNGQMRDRVEVMQDLGNALKNMEYYKGNAYANSLGIDENTFMAMRDGSFNAQLEKYQTLRTKMGYNTELAKSGQEFAYQWRDLTMQLKALSEVVLMTAGQALIPVLKVINAVLQAIIQWFGELDPRLKEFLKAGLKIAMLTVVFGGLFAAISKILKLVPLLKGLIFVIRALSLSFLMTPIGMVLAFAAAIALLFEDYMGWKNGSESLIDWDKWGAGIDKAITKIKELGGWLQDLTKQGMDLMLGEGSYEGAVDWTSRKVIEPAATLYNKTVEGATDLIEKGVSIFTGAGSKEEPVNPVTPQPNTAVTENTISAKQVFQESVSVMSNAMNSVSQFAKDVVGDANQKAEDNTGGRHLGWLSAKYEGKVGSANRDVDQDGNPAGWAYGKYQFNSAKGGLQRFFADNPEYAAKFKDLKPETAAFNKKWKEIAKLEHDAFEKAQDKSAANLWFKPAESAYAKAGFNLQNEGVREAIFSASIQHGGVVRKLLPLIQKNATKDISEMSPEEQLKLIYQGRTQYHRRGASRYADELKTALSVANNSIVLNPLLNKLPTTKEGLLRFAQNAEVPNNIKPIVPNVSDTQSSNRNVSINQKTDIHIVGGDATMTAQAVRKEQDVINLQLVRNSKGVFG